MLTKADRSKLILSLIDSQTLRTQSELARALHASGVDVNQSTLSRDLAELEVAKVDGRYRVAAKTNGSNRLDVSPAVVRWTTCGPHMIVVRTHIGLAQSVAVEIDRSNESSVAGTIAGDDTLFIATKSRRQQSVVLRRLQQWFGDKHER